MRKLLILLLLPLLTWGQRRVPLTTGGPTPTAPVRKLSLGTTGAAASAPVRRLALSASAGLVTDPFQFSLASAATTSIGVYRPDGTLVRTLESNVQRSAGLHTLQWDGLDDLGAAVSNPGECVIYGERHNLAISWGLIGNTSASLTGPNKFRTYYNGTLDFVIVGSAMYYCTGYSEGRSPIFKTTTTAPTSCTEVLPLAGGNEKSAQATTHLATDGTRIYWGGGDSSEGLNAQPTDPYPTYVFATNVSNDAEYSFSSGAAHTALYGRTYVSVADKVVATVGAKKVITGLAVQTTGNYLFVARKTDNSVHVLNKLTGALVQNLTITAPEMLKVNPASDNELWMISNGALRKYTIQGDGTLSAPSLTLASLSKPLAMGINPAGTSIVVADADTAQRLKTYSTSTGSIQAVYGQQGGYMTDCNVTADRFYFSDLVKTELKTCVGFEPGGALWLYDPGNFRTLRYTVSGTSLTYSSYIMFMPATYTMSVDKNDPTRLFAGYLEFQVDYSKTLDNGQNGSWVLKRNWRGGIPSQFYPGFEALLMESPRTLSNGRTYAMITGTNNRRTVAEISTGLSLIRFTSTELDVFGFEDIAPDGSIRYANDPDVAGGVQTYYRRPLTGFSGADPVWGTAVTIGTNSGVPITGYINQNNAQTTSSGLVVVFDQTKDATGNVYHLGGFPEGGSGNFRWKTALSTHPSYLGDYPEDGRFDIGNNTNDPGGQVQVVGNYILWSHYGEFYKGAQTNKYQLLTDKGLLLTTFGVNRYEAPDAMRDPIAQIAGNALGHELAMAGGKLYLYHGEESVHSAVHRYEIGNLESIQPLSVVHSPGYTVPSPGTHLLAGLPETYGQALADGTGSWSRFPTTNTAQNGATMTATTGSKSYKKGLRDIGVSFTSSAGASATHYVRRSLGSYTGNNWEVTGLVNMDGMEGNTAACGLYLDVRDGTGKVICRLDVQGAYPNMSVVLNSAVCSTADGKVIQAYIKKNRRFRVWYNGTALQAQYGDYAPVTLTAHEAGAALNAPRELQVTGTATGASNSGRTMYLKEFFFKTL